MLKYQVDGDALRLLFLATCYSFPPHACASHLAWRECTSPPVSPRTRGQFPVSLPRMSSLSFFIAISFYAKNPGAVARRDEIASWGDTRSRRCREDACQEASRRLEDQVRPSSSASPWSPCLPVRIAITPLSRRRLPRSQPPSWGSSTSFLFRFPLISMPACTYFLLVLIDSVSVRISMPVCESEDHVFLLLIWIGLSMELKMIYLLIMPHGRKKKLFVCLLFFNFTKLKW